MKKRNCPTIWRPVQLGNYFHWTGTMTQVGGDYSRRLTYFVWNRTNSILLVKKYQLPYIYLNITSPKSCFNIPLASPQRNLLHIKVIIVHNQICGREKYLFLFKNLLLFDSWKKYWKYRRLSSVFVLLQKNYKSTKLQWILKC